MVRVVRPEELLSEGCLIKMAESLLVVVVELGFVNVWGRRKTILE